MIIYSIQVWKSLKQFGLDLLQHNAIPQLEHQIWDWGGFCWDDELFFLKRYQHYKHPSLLSLYSG